MKTVNIFLFLVLTIISAIFVGLTLSNKFNNREEFVTKVLPASSNKRCIRNNADEDNMNRKTSRPACFFNDIDTENKQLIGLTAKVRDRTDDIIRKSTMIDDNLHTRATEGSKKIDLILRSDDLNNFNKYMLDTNNKTIDNKNKTVAILNKLNTNNVTIDENATLNKIRIAVSKLVSNGIDRIISTSSTNMSKLISDKFTFEHSIQIISKLSSLIYDKINNNIVGDINDMVNNLVETEKLDKVITMSIENIMREDKSFASYMSGGNNNIKIGDFVYFKHKVSNNNADLCIDNDSQKEIIVGGRVCSINPLTNNVKINYLYTTNPNFNKRCSTNPSISYDKGVSGLPKWYISTGRDLTMKCGPGPIADGGCKPSQWSTDKDNYVRQFVGGFDRNKDEMSCGVGPTASNDYPQEVNIKNLSKSLEDVVNSCQSKMSAIPLEAEPLPRPRYTESSDIMLPMPKFDELPPPRPQKSAQQLEREEIERQSMSQLSAAEQAEISGLDSTNSRAGSGQVDLTRRQANRIDQEAGPRRQSTSGAQPSGQDQAEGQGQPTSGSTGTRQSINVQARRDPNNDAAVNRCINGETDNNKDIRYIQNKTGNRFRIVNGQATMAPMGSTKYDPTTDKVLPLPKGLKPLYLFKKQSSDTILAYGQDKKWYQYISVEKPGSMPGQDPTFEQKFVEIGQTELTEKYDGEINPTGSCVTGNKV